MNATLGIRPTTRPKNPTPTERKNGHLLSGRFFDLRSGLVGPTEPRCNQGCHDDMAPFYADFRVLRTSLIVIP